VHAVPAGAEPVARSLIGPANESVERHGHVKNGCGHGVRFPGLRSTEIVGSRELIAGLTTTSRRSPVEEGSGCLVRDRITPALDEEQARAPDLRGRPRFVRSAGACGVADTPALFIVAALWVSGDWPGLQPIKGGSAVPRVPQPEERERGARPPLRFQSAAMGWRAKNSAIALATGPGRWICNR
jgi:hypothetical protein